MVDADLKGPEDDDLGKIIFRQYLSNRPLASGGMRARRTLTIGFHNTRYSSDDHYALAFSCLHDASILGGPYSNMDQGLGIVEGYQSGGNYQCGCGLVVKSDLVPMPSLSTAGTPCFILDIKVKGESIGFSMVLRRPRR